ncbi:MAG: site-specific DNA-methyltransferase [Pyrinomonadaceae bacterium]|nr:site-specific DNA-methyltransferase [Pyrinomonadaceae bacterium]
MTSSLNINEIYQGDARELLPQVESDSISCSVWSPPYHLGKEYEKGISYDEWIGLLKDVIGLHYSILKPGGFLVINIADILCFPDESIPRFQAMNVSRHKVSITREEVLEAKAANPNYNRNQLAALLGCSEQTIDRRLNGNNIRGGKYNTQTRVHLVGNIIQDAATAANLYLYDRRIWMKDPAWENSKWATLSYRAVDEFEYLYFFWKPGTTIVDRSKLTSEEWASWGSRAVWQIPSVRANNDHEAKFPLELPRRVIKLLTFPDDTVLDCFMGSGTTAVAAIREGRNYIGIEKQSGYVSLARESCEKEKQKWQATNGQKTYKSEYASSGNQLTLLDKF